MVCVMLLMLNLKLKVNMKYKIIVFLGITITLFYNKAISQTVKLNADSLIVNIEKYIDKTVEVEGNVAHICGVDAMKMKIKSNSGADIKIIPNEKLGKIDFSINKKNVKVIGKVSEFRIDTNFVVKLEKDQALLCSIDKSACIDSIWVKKKWESGTAANSSKEATLKLRERIKNSPKGYVTLVTIIAEKIEVIE